MLLITTVLSVLPSASATAGEEALYVPMSPARVSDTRVGPGPIGKLPAYTERGVRVGGVLGIPANASAVTVNVTITQPDQDGWVTTWSCNVTRPGTSNLNFAAGQTVTNSAVVKTSPDGHICIMSSATAHVLIDVVGWYPSAAEFQSMTPQRVLDSRNGPGDVGQLAPGAVVQIPVGNRSTVPDGTTAIMVNLTITQSAEPGWAVAWPCGQPQPPTSSINFSAGETKANRIITPLGPGASLCLVAWGSAHAVVDVFGWYPGDAQYRPIQPVRAVDSRASAAPIAAGGAIVIQVAGRFGVAGDSSAVDLNVAAVHPDASGWFTVYPCGSAVPKASDLNFKAGQAAANSTTVKVGLNGQVCIYSSATAHVIVDVAGWHPYTSVTNPVDFHTGIRGEVPYKDVFIHYGILRGVEPSLLAGLAEQESNFNPNAGCDGTSTGGKGILQHENQPQYCGVAQVPASVDKTAWMLADYKRRFGDWHAAVFAYNNGPGLVDEYLAYRHHKPTLISVLAAYYDRQSYAKPGPMRGYPTWGTWRAHIAVNYVAEVPESGFRSAVQKWYNYRA